MSVDNQDVLGKRIDWLRATPQTFFSTNVPGTFRRALLLPETRSQVEHLGWLSVLGGGGEFTQVSQPELYLVRNEPPEPVAA
jgi:hypothetical protein